MLNTLTSKADKIRVKERTKMQRDDIKTKVIELLNQLSQNELTELHQLIVRRYALDGK